MKAATAAATATALAASLLMGLAGDASAAGLELVGVDMTDHYQVTLKVDRLTDLRAMMIDVGFDEASDATSFEHELSEAGLTFTYSGSWTDSPLLPGHATARGGIGSLTETSASGQRFSLDFSYNSPAKLDDGSELVTFAIKPPPGDWGTIELTTLKLNPFTIDIGSLTADQAPLASFTLASVPEPSINLLMVAGLAAFGWMRRLNRRGGMGSRSADSCSRPTGQLPA